MIGLGSLGILIVLYMGYLVYGSMVLFIWKFLGHNIHDEGSLILLESWF